MNMSMVIDLGSQLLFCRREYPPESHRNSSARFSLDITLRDHFDGRIYLFENYQLALRSESGNTDVAISGGRFYNPDNGYVDVSTTVPLRVNEPRRLAFFRGADRGGKGWRVDDQRGVRHRLPGCF